MGDDYNVAGAFGMMCSGSSFGSFASCRSRMEASLKERTKMNHDDDERLHRLDLLSDLGKCAQDRGCPLSSRCTQGWPTGTQGTSPRTSLLVRAVILVTLGSFCCGSSAPRMLERVGKCAGRLTH